MKWLLLALTVSLIVALTILFPMPADAQCHRARVVVATPYISYAPAYVAPVVKIVKAIPVVVQPDYYYSVSDGYRDALLADAIAFRVLLAQKQFGSGGGPGTAPPAAPVPRYREPPATPGDAPRTMPPAADTGAVLPALATLIGAKCVKCHASGKNGINLDTTNLPSLTRAEWLECSLRVSIDGEGAMPKGGPALSGEDASLFASAALQAKKK